MAGYNLKEGQYEARSVSDDELWSINGIIGTCPNNVVSSE